MTPNTFSTCYPLIQPLFRALPNPRPHLVVVAGPTAVGKTEAAVSLALALGAEVVSADARQCYRELSIGTAKPTPDERRGVPHHFVDSRSVTDEYNARAFAQDALATLADLHQRHPVAIAVGGSGLYLRALTDGLDDLPDVPPGVRNALLATLAHEGIGALQEDLRQRDPAYYATVDRQNPQRLVRALEVCLATGLPYSSFRQNQPAPRPFIVHKIVLTRPREVLYDRINQRVEAMLATGLVEEVRGLQPYRHLNALQTVGYQEVFGWLDGAYDAGEMKRLLQQNTRRYAKRQLTWLRREADYTWLPADDPAALLAHVRRALAGI